MVVEETTKNKGNARKGTRSTSKKKKQQHEDSPESSDDETKAETSVTERTKRTLKAAELKATETFLKAREYLDSNQVKAITQTYGVTTRRELGLLTRAHITDEILTGESKKIPRLQGSKISALTASLAETTTERAIACTSSTFRSSASCTPPHLFSAVAACAAATGCSH